MKIKIPEQFMGMQVEGAMDRVLKKNLSPEAKPEQVVPDANAPDLKGMIYVQSVNLYFAKERSLLGKNWFDAHKLAQAQELKMPTIMEFIEFLKYLRNNPGNENTAIYKEITEIKEPWRAEWLDADFKVKNNKLCINYNHKLDSNGNLVPQNSEPLENCLMKDCYADILKPNKQGLPTEKSKTEDFYYWCPRSDNNSVAGFDACFDVASVGCYWDPSDWDSSLGVRLVVRPKGAS